MQVKGLMPPEDGISRGTPTGRAVGRNMVWHNFLNDLRIVYAVYIFLSLLLYFSCGFLLGCVNG